MIWTKDRSGQEYPEGYSYDSIEIQSETEPYGLTVFLKDEPSAAKLEDELQVNADMTFDLIGNLGTIDYKTADSKEIIASYDFFLVRAGWFRRIFCSFWYLSSHARWEKTSGSSTLR